MIIVGCHEIHSSAPLQTGSNVKYVSGGMFNLELDGIYVMFEKYLRVKV